MKKEKNTRSAGEKLAEKTTKGKRNALLSRIISLLTLSFLPLFIFFCEYIFKICIFGAITAEQALFSFLFSVSIGTAITLFARAFASLVAYLAENNNIIRPLTGVLVGIAAFAFFALFAAQFVYFGYFSDFFKWSTIDMAGSATQFAHLLVETALKNWYWLALMLLPVILFFVFIPRKMPRHIIHPVGMVILLSLSVFSHLGAEAVIYLDDEDYGNKEYYTSIFDAKYSAQNFGLLTSTRLDILQLIRGGAGIKDNIEDFDPDDAIDLNEGPNVIVKPGDQNTPGGIIDPGFDDPDNPDDPDIPDIPKQYDYNYMDIDFDALIAGESDSTIKSMHKYFKAQTGTKQNRYTGYFEGKNLIFITLEGFSHKVISKELTPTLYKMSTEGFVFNNFYNSLWGGSTATGEYAVITGNFYKNAKCLQMSADTYQPFALGNQFSALGYNTTAYHNHTYTYYDRNLSHPNFGYTWKAIGGGLTLPSKSWPNSDYEMAQVTAPEFVSKTPFLTYYMTVSGHANYTFYGNTMASKHKVRVSGLTQYCDNVRAYIACNLEVEDMLTELMDQLRAAGTLDDTVFVITEDHYPYALQDSEIAELYGVPNDEKLFSNFDIYRNFFTIYSTSMKNPIVVNEPCSAIDILPTVLNLFGIEYDSRLITGTDVLSETPNVAILNCDRTGPSWNWITRYGSYNTQTKVFTPAEGVEFENAAAIKSYVSQINEVVRQRRTYSYLILEEDYYRHVFKK